MSLIGDIARAYRAPAKAFKVQLQRAGEERILLFIFLFCFLSFVARLPDLARITALSHEPIPLSARVGAMFVSSVFMAPLMMYLVAALSHLVLRMFGGKGSWRLARMALAWAALVTVPLVLISGGTKVFAPGLPFSIATALTGVVFLWQWVTALKVVEFSTPDTP